MRTTIALALLCALSASADPAEWAKQIGKLGAREYAVRERAHASLRAAGPAALPALRAALKAGPSVEVRARLQALIARAEVTKAWAGAKAGTPAGGLELSLRTASGKLEFPAGAAIPLRWRLRNVGKTPIRIGLPDNGVEYQTPWGSIRYPGCELRLIAEVVRGPKFDSDGTELASPAYPPRRRTALLGPGGRHVAGIDAQRALRTRLGYGPLPPGTYKLTLRYLASRGVVEGARADPVSNALTIRVTGKK